MTITAPQQGIPFVTENRTLSNSGLIFLQQLRNSIVSILPPTGGSGGGSATVPIWSSVANFGADPTGSTDSSLAIQRAINSLPANGGTVYFPVGTYLVNSTITLGTGSSSANSSVHGIQLWGEGGVNEPGLTDNSFVGSVRLKWNGAPGGGPLINIVGPIGGCGLQNLVLDAGTGAATGLQYRSASYGFFKNLTVVNFRSDGILGLTWDPFTTNFADSLHNTFINTNILVPDVGSARGIRLDGGLTSAGSVTSDTDYNTFINTTIFLPATATTTYGIFLRVCDANSFYQVHIIGAGSGNIGVNLDYSFNSNFPSSNKFYQIDNAMATQWQNSGSPPSNPILVNEIIGITAGNGAKPPALQNLAYTGYGIIGYSTPGSSIGGSVSQITRITTSVTLNNICGQITTVSNAFTAGTLVSFNVSNTSVAATDTVILNVKSTSAGGAIAFVSAVGAASFTITIDPTATATFTVTLNFAVLKAVNS